MNQITNLRNGTIVNKFYGKVIDGVLQLPVSGIADEDAFVTVNGVEAQRLGLNFTAVIPVSQKVTEITMAAENSCGKVTHTIHHHLNEQITPLNQYQHSTYQIRISTPQVFS